MTVRVEFFGMARRYAGCATIDVDAATLGEALGKVAAALPAVGNACISGSALRSGYIANVNGRIFTRETDCPLSDGDSVLILSNDMGGYQIALVQSPT
jgi:molybdopterin converting factor small subunit